MDLILWRHADTRELHEGQDDAARQLTSKGERQAKRMAAWLNQQLPQSTRILVSPTQRTLQTAKALDRKFKVVPGLAPDQTVDALLTAARWPDAADPVLVVGHQYTLGLTAAYLMAGATQPWVVRKGAVWWLRMRKREQGDEVMLLASMSPELV
jgi:phosphohistidine phosphatase